MSLDEIEEKFNIAQLILISTIQKLTFDQEKKERKRGRIVNRGKTIDEINRDAFRRL